MEMMSQISMYYYPAFCLHKTWSWKKKVWCHQQLCLTCSNGIVLHQSFFLNVATIFWDDTHIRVSTEQRDQKIGWHPTYIVYKKVEQRVPDEQELYKLMIKNEPTDLQLTVASHFLNEQAVL